VLGDAAPLGNMLHHSAAGENTNHQVGRCSRSSETRLELAQAACPSTQQTGNSEDITFVAGRQKLGRSRIARRQDETNDNRYGRENCSIPEDKATPLKDNGEVLD